MFMSSALASKDESIPAPGEGEGTAATAVVEDAPRPLLSESVGSAAGTAATSPGRVDSEEGRARCLALITVSPGCAPTSPSSFAGVVLVDD